MSDLEEAYAIMAGSTMKLPEVKHLKALLDAHWNDLQRLQKEMKELREGIGK